VSDEDAAHLLPAQHDHINFHGTYTFDLETAPPRRTSPAALSSRLIAVDRPRRKGPDFAPLLRGPLPGKPTVRKTQLLGGTG